MLWVVTDRMIAMIPELHLTCACLFAFEFEQAEAEREAKYPNLPDPHRIKSMIVSGVGSQHCPGLSRFGVFYIL